MFRRRGKNCTVRTIGNTLWAYWYRKFYESNYLQIFWFQFRTKIPQSVRLTYFPLPNFLQPITLSGFSRQKQKTSCITDPINLLEWTSSRQEQKKNCITDPINLLEWTSSRQEQKKNCITDPINLLEWTSSRQEQKKNCITDPINLLEWTSSRQEQKKNCITDPINLLEWTSSRQEQKTSCVTDPINLLEWNTKRKTKQKDRHAAALHSISGPVWQKLMFWKMKIVKTQKLWEVLQFVPSSRDTITSVGGMRRVIQHRCTLRSSNSSKQVLFSIILVDYNQTEFVQL